MTDAAPARVVWVPFERLAPWRARFDGLHPDSVWRVRPDGEAVDSLVHGEAALGYRVPVIEVVAPDGAAATIPVPFPGLDDLSFERVVEHLARPWRAGLLLVRRGGYAVGLLRGGDLVASSVGRRHVQGRTKAGGWSQQRFQRRRENQAQVAFDAAAGHAAEILGSERLDVLGVGGDHHGVDTALAQPALRHVAASPRTWLEVSGDPDRKALAAAVARLRSLRVTVVDPTRAGRGAAG